MKEEEIKVGKIYSNGKNGRNRKVIKITPPNTYLGYEVYYVWPGCKDESKPDGINSLNHFARWAHHEVVTP